MKSMGKKLSLQEIPNPQTIEYISTILMESAYQYFSVNKYKNNIKVINIEESTKKLSGDTSIIPYSIT